MGGKVVQRIMADVPERIKSAIAITPVPAAKIPFDEQGWHLFSNAAADSMKRLEIFRLATANRLTDSWYQMINEKSMKACKPEAFAAYLDSWVNYEFIDEIRGNTVPIKVMTGEHDADLTYALLKSTLGEWLPNTQIIELKNCGHYPMFETPLSLAAECENFLLEHI